jgi:multidrug efflux pump subunit AcrA (membrane-fusion protein)
VPKRSSGWSRAGHRRAVLIGGVVLIAVLGGGVAAWAEVGGGNGGYRMATVTRADIGTTLTVVGNVEPVTNAAASFQVGGQVATVTVTPGAQVTAGETLGTLDTAALSETVSSAQSKVDADEAKLVEDENSQSSAASTPASHSPSASSTSSTTTTTTSPTHGSPNGGGGQDSTVTQDQTALTEDESTLSTAQQQEAADLAQAQKDCTSANTATPTGQAACETALQTVSADEQLVSKDQATVSKDESALAQALAAESSAGTGSGTGSGTGPGSTGTGNSGSSPTQSGHALSSDPGVTGNTGAGSSGSTPAGTQNNAGNSGSGATSNADTPEQIASDQAAIDTAQANLTEAQQSLNEATLTSPITGTVVSVGIKVGDTVSANSSTEIITIIGTNAYEVEATLDSSQIPSVKVGQSATAEVDGVDGTLVGTVSQVGPVQSSSSGYTYPVVVALPTSATGLFPGSDANVNIATGQVSDVVAVPTSAVQTLGTRSYVLELSKGQLTRKVVKIGMVGDVYTQVTSGLSPGQSVVLVDYTEAVPSSNTNTLGGVGNLLGGGSGGGFFGGGGFPGGLRVQRIGSSGAGNASIG